MSTLFTTDPTHPAWMDHSTDLDEPREPLDLLTCLPLEQRGWKSEKRIEENGDEA
jgi:hypothetical protein